MKDKILLLTLFLLVIIIIIVTIADTYKPAKDVSGDYVGEGFIDMGPILTLHKEGKYILAVFNNTDDIEVEYYGLKDSSIICKFSISQPIQEGFSLEVLCPEGRYIISCGGKKKTYISHGEKVTISYR